MSTENRVRYVILNHQSHPLEVHLASGVLLVGPRSEMEVTQDVIDSQQIQTLQRQRVITLREIIEIVDEPPAPAAAAPKKTKTAVKPRAAARKKG